MSLLNLITNFEPFAVIFMAKHEYLLNFYLYPFDSYNIQTMKSNEKYLESLNETILMKQIFRVTDG